MKDRELIARIIINILDVKNCQQWELFTGEDMYEQVCNYILNISKGNNTAEEYARKMMKKTNRSLIGLFKVKIFLMKSIMCLRNLLENITESLEDSNPIFNDIKKRLILLGAFY